MPEELEALLVPPDDRFRLDDDEDGTPVRPEAGQPSPEDSVTVSEPWTLGLMLQDRELLAESKVFGSQRGLIAKK